MVVGVGSGVGRVRRCRRDDATTDKSSAEGDVGGARSGRRDDDATTIEPSATERDDDARSTKLLGACENAVAVSARKQKA